MTFSSNLDIQRNLQNSMRSYTCAPIVAAACSRAGRDLEFQRSAVCGHILKTYDQQLDARLERRAPVVQQRTGRGV
jgi:hypothetical protein